MSFEITPSGFVIERFEDIRARLNQRFIDAFGDVDTSDRSVIGQINTLVADAAFRASERAEQVYNSYYRLTASGAALDNAVTIIGVTRRAAVPSTATAVAFGTQGTVLPPGTQVSVSPTRDLFALDAQTTISTANAIQTTFGVTDVIVGETVSVLINITPFSYTVQAGDTSADVAASLAAEITLAPVTVTTSGDSITLVADDPRTAYTFAIQSGSLDLQEVGALATFTALEPGPITVPVGALNRIETPFTGFDRVTNLIEGVTGADRESDQELRARASLSQTVTGAATPNAIRARLIQDVQNVSEATVIENDTSIIDAAGRPAKSYEVLVVGGDDQAIAENIFETKPAGVETFGNVTRTVLDDSGQSQSVSFSRPDEVLIWFEVTITPSTDADDEETPPDILTATAQAIVDRGAELPIGRDVFPNRFVGPVHEAAAGIEVVSITVGAGATEPAIFDASPIVIAPTEIARFDLSRVNVTVV